MDRNKAVGASKEIDEGLDYETGYEDRMIGSLKKIKRLAAKRLVLGIAVERALKTGKSVTVIKRISNMGVKTCAAELKETLVFLDALLRDRMLHIANKGKTGQMTKDEMVSNLKELIGEFDGSYNELIAETEKSSDDKDTIALFDRLNKLATKHETEISRLYGI